MATAITSDAELPYDIGAEAYRCRKLPEQNPYPKGCMEHDEWLLGWLHYEESDPAQSFDWATGKFK